MADYMYKRIPAMALAKENAENDSNPTLPLYLKVIIPI